MLLLMSLPDVFMQANLLLSHCNSEDWSDDDDDDGDDTFDKEE